MPPLLQGDRYLLQDFVATGRVEHGPMGIIPLSWQAVHAWASLSGADITGGEAELLRAMSAAYVGAFRSASERNPEPPYVGPADE